MINCDNGQRALEFLKSKTENLYKEKNYFII